MIGIMQPYFLPYLGHLQLMEKCEKWVIFDDIQFIDKGWINRNKIAHPNKKKEIQFITIPLKNRSQKSLISKIEIDNSKDWKSNIRGKFSFYKKKVRYYDDAKKFLDQVLDITSDNLSDFLHNQFLFFNEYFKLKIKIILQSKEIVLINHNSNLEKDEWALEITKFLGEHAYINPASGIHIFDKKKFNRSKITLKKFLPDIDQISMKHQGYLSIIDVLARLGYAETMKNIKKGLILDV